MTLCTLKAVFKCLEENALAAYNCTALEAHATIVLFSHDVVASLAAIPNTQLFYVKNYFFVAIRAHVKPTFVVFIWPSYQHCLAVRTNIVSFCRKLPFVTLISVVPHHRSPHLIDFFL
jgi:hypothetical protein